MTRASLLLALCLGSCSLPAGGGAPLGSAHFAQTGGGASVASLGAIEFEADYDHEPGEATSTAIGLVVGLPDDFEASVSWSPYDVLVQPGPDSRGSGDTAFAIKKRLLAASASHPEWSLELGTQLDTSEAGHLERSGEADLFLATAASQNFGAHTWTAYYEVVFPDNPDSSSTELEHVAALQWAAAPLDSCVVYAEGIGTVVPAVDFSATYLGTGVAWGVSDTWTLEAGALIGLAGESEDFRLLLGFTTVLADLSKLGMFGL